VTPDRGPRFSSSACHRSWDEPARREPRPARAGRHEKLSVARYTGGAIAKTRSRFSVPSKHCALIHILGGFVRHLHDEELRVQSHSWCEPVQANSENQKVEPLQIQSADFSSNFVRRREQSERRQNPIASMETFAARQRRRLTSRAGAARNELLVSQAKLAWSSR
jgi:hypothetical protein